MARTKYKKGFHTVVNGRRMDVFFRSYNQKVVICKIADQTSGLNFLGKARCNFDEGDVYNEEEGMKLAFSRAMVKRINHYEHVSKKVMEELDTVRMYLPQECQIKLKILIEAGSIRASDPAEDSQAS